MNSDKQLSSRKKKYEADVFEGPAGLPSKRFTQHDPIILVKLEHQEGFERHEGHEGLEAHEGY